MGGVFLLLSKISLYGTTLILVILVLVLSLKFNKKTEEKINNEVSNEYIASYFDGEYQTEIPGKDDGYVVDKIVCDNGATATWDNEDWGINIRNATQKIKCSIYFNFKTEYDFDYTGTEQSFMVPKSGKYKLETWGAQGGSHSEEKHGGYGGYSVGTITLLKSDILYLNIGGSGKVNDKLPGEFTKGGYNGGGDTYTNDKAYLLYGSSGGGATHIATASGLLNNLEESQNNILIVSGGGGGSNYDIMANVTTGIGGSGGGKQGANGTPIYYKGNVITDAYATGGSQNTFGAGATSNIAYSNGNDGSFGLGGNSGYNAGAGGGGYYGGGGGATSNKDSSGGGGSGYIGNSLLTNKAMYCYNCEENNEESTKTISTTCAEETPTANCAKKGNGYARITYIN